MSKVFLGRGLNKHLVYPEWKWPDESSSKEQADYYVVAARVGSTTTYSVYQNNSKLFSVDTTDWEEAKFSTEFYGRLVKQIEERVGKKNISIEIP